MLFYFMKFFTPTFSIEPIKNNRIVSGIDAIAAIVIRLPLLVPLWPLIKLSSIFGVGQKLYNHIAKTRRIVPVNNCEGDSCEIK